MDEQHKFDFVVVGGGSAGCVLASRLSENPLISVCLLEAGGDGKGILIRAPAAVVAMMPGRPKINNWAYETVPQAGLNGRKGYQPRGKSLGGSSAINAMLYIRGHKQDYDDWESAGCKGWGWNDVLPYFRRSENNQRGEDRLHGEGGPLQVSNQQSPRPISHAFVAAASEMQIRRSDDFNGDEQEGAGIYQVTQFHGDGKNGERCSAAAAYLHPVMERDNLTVVTGAHATKILFEGKRAIGVQYRKNKRSYSVFAAHEILVSGGAFNSPQLLLLSGVGPENELRKQGIAVVQDLPGVGENLQDHIDFTLAYKSKETDLFGLGIRGGIRLLKHIWQWRKNGSGMFATPFAEAGAFIKTDQRLERPDIQLHFVISIVDDHARKLHYGYGYSCHICVLRPNSRGSVKLASSDPMAAPMIDPQFFSDKRDLDLLIKGTKLTREILAAPALKKYCEREVYTKGPQTDEQWAEHLRSRADTVYHPVGTCKMGVDKDCVVDPQLNVYGVEGLRVVDASVMPTLIGGNTNAPTMMVAEKAAAMILEKFNQS